MAWVWDKKVEAGWLGRTNSSRILGLISGGCSYTRKVYNMMT